MSNAQKVSALIREIRELNLAGVDENGHRWANSDLINQTCVEALNVLRAAPTPDAHSEVGDDAITAVHPCFKGASHIWFYHEGSQDRICTKCGSHRDWLVKEVVQSHSEVGVKDLEWTDWGSGRYTAKSMGASYSIRSGGALADGAFDLEINSYTAKKGGFPTLAQAKAASHADFAQRVQSCLTAGVESGPMATHRHLKRGTEYVLIGIGKMQAEGWHDPSRNNGKVYGPNVDMREVAIYRSVIDPTGIWVRPREEFEDGRFAALASKPEGDR